MNALSTSTTAIAANNRNKFDSALRYMATEHKNLKNTTEAYWTKFLTFFYNKRTIVTLVKPNENGTLNIVGIQ
jgi:hypothetical protein